MKWRLPVYMVVATNCYDVEFFATASWAFTFVVTLLLRPVISAVWIDQTSSTDSLDCQPCFPIFDEALVESSIFIQSDISSSFLSNVLILSITKDGIRNFVQSHLELVIFKQQKDRSCCWSDTIILILVNTSVDPILSFLEQHFVHLKPKTLNNFATILKQLFVALNYYLHMHRWFNVNFVPHIR